MTIAAEQRGGRKLAITRLRERRPLDGAAIDRFLARHQVPIVEGGTCTFCYRGDADAVQLIHRVVGLPDRLPLRRIAHTDLWYLVLELPDTSRVEYQLEVTAGGDVQRINDPLNPHRSHSPVGSSSVCFARGYVTPDWTVPDPESRRGELIEMPIASRALRRESRCRVYLPARFRTTTRYPLLVVHDGSDFLQYAAAKTVLDNLIHRLDVAETVVAFTDPGDRLIEYANSAAHARFITHELIPRLEAELPLIGQPSGRCLLGSSFGAVASLSAAYRYPDAIGSLVLMSGSFVFTDIGDEHDDDDDKHTMIQSAANGDFLVNALTPIAEFNERFGCDFSDEEYDTVGGMITAEIGHLPEVGEEATLGGFHFHVTKADARRVQQFAMRVHEA